MGYQYLRSLSLSGFLVCFLTYGSALAIPTKQEPRGPAFAQLSSAVDQQPGNLVQFATKDSLQGLSSTANSVNILQKGSYLIIASPQVTATGDGSCLDAWIVVNQVAVKNSGVRICQAKAGDTNVVVSQVMMNLKPGDKVQVQTSGKNAKLDAIEAKGEPLIPSIIFTVFGLGF
jgi:hypothetical protein